MWSGILWRLLAKQGYFDHVDSRVVERKDVRAWFLSFLLIQELEGWLILIIFFCVYYPIHNADKSRMWEELATVKELWNCPWCVAGDFNVVRSLSYRKCWLIWHWRWEVYLEEHPVHVQVISLIDIPKLGGAFSRRQYCLPKPNSNHVCGLLDCDSHTKADSIF